MLSLAISWLVLAFNIHPSFPKKIIYIHIAGPKLVWIAYIHTYSDAKTRETRMVYHENLSSLPRNNMSIKNKNVK